MRTAKLLGSKVGRLTMARISPLRGSIATMAPFLSAMACSAASCISTSTGCFRLVPRDRYEMTHPAAYLLRGRVQALGNRNGVGIEVPALIAQQQRGKGGIVVDDSPSFAVQNFSAGRENGNVADAILFRLRRVEVLLHNLEAP